jgi:NAD(P)-dependent dehydrogenase (short-subunit alcohol dehydrogenase family)
MPGRLLGKIALISGGATGMGGASSKLFAAEGAKVGVVDRNEEAGRAVVAEIERAGGTAMFAAADVADEAQVNAAVAAVTAALGAPNVLFNAVLPGMIAAGGGSIVCTSSISAIAATPREVVYNTSKGACHMFARSIAVEYRDQNIRCNAVCPGFVRTPHGLREVDALNKLGVDMSDAALAVQQGRICEPEEVARAALFLASDEASFINGAHLFVDNCFTAV